MIERLQGDPLLLAWLAIAVAGILGALRVLFSFQASSPLVFRLLFLPKIPLPFFVRIGVTRHESSLLTLIMDATQRQI